MARPAGGRGDATSARGDGAAAHRRRRERSDRDRLRTRLLEVLRQAGTETHLVITPAAGMTRACETDLSAEDLRALADVSYPIGDLTAPISSGSFQTMGMIVAPCSMRSLAEIAYGMTGNLLTRAADVTL